MRFFVDPRIKKQKNTRWAVLRIARKHWYQPLFFAVIKEVAKNTQKPQKKLKKLLTFKLI